MFFGTLIPGWLLISFAWLDLKRSLRIIEVNEGAIYFETTTFRNFYKAQKEWIKKEKLTIEVYRLKPRNSPATTYISFTVKGDWNHEGYKLEEPVQFWYEFLSATYGKHFKKKRNYWLNLIQALCESGYTISGEKKLLEFLNIPVSSRKLLEV